MAGRPGTRVQMTAKGNSSKAWAITLPQCRGNTACALAETFEYRAQQGEAARVTMSPVNMDCLLFSSAGQSGRIVRSLSDSVPWVGWQGWLGGRSGGVL